MKNKPPLWMFRNSKGEKDGLWTLLVISFVTTTVAYVMSMFESITFGGSVITFRAFDGLGYAAVVLVPMIGGYFGRRYTKAVNETANARAKIYAEVVKRNVGSQAVADKLVNKVVTQATGSLDDEEV